MSSVPYPTGDDARPLSESEQKLLVRLLSDPFSLPYPFKTWLISYLETSDLNLPLSAVAGLPGLLGTGALLSGTILLFAGDDPPEGTRLADGSSVSRAEEPRLFRAIGTKYGEPDADHFSLPDLSSQIPNVHFIIVT